MESNHVIPRYQRGAVTVWLMPQEWSRECSNLPLPGFNRPLHPQYVFGKPGLTTQGSTTR